jgi:hypothetical protein
MLTFPNHLLEPVEWLNFIELHGFRDDWKRLTLDDEDLFAMQLAIQAFPNGSPVIKGIGGLRKMRFAAKKKYGVKKAIRVGYVYFPEASTIVLVVAYAKNEKDNLSPADKKAIRAFIEREHAVLTKRAVR